MYERRGPARSKTRHIFRSHARYCVRIEYGLREKRKANTKCGGIHPPNFFRAPDLRFRAGDRRSYVSSCLPIGSARMRFPVAAKIALAKAGANGGTPGSPTPLGGVSAATGTMCTLV